MRLSILLENTALSSELECAHGLSIYIESDFGSLVFDFGPNDMFLRNAERLGIELSEADWGFLSHGHMDHGGGLPAFLSCGSSAPVIAAPGALGAYYAMKPDGSAKAIGLNPVLRHSPRIVYDTKRLPDGLLVLRDVSAKALMPQTNSNLMCMKSDSMQPDCFCHEQNLLIHEGDKWVLIAGCAHRGILNIIDSAKKLCGSYPECVIGGFHLFSNGTGATEKSERIALLGHALAALPCRYITGHCTGEVPFRTLKKILGERLEAMSTGSQFII